jgi:porin
MNGVKTPRTLACRCAEALSCLVSPSRRDGIAAARVRPASGWRTHARLLAVAMAVALPCIALAQPAAENGQRRDAGTPDWEGLRYRAQESGVTFNASYAGEAAANLSGGDRQTARYTQQVEVETLLDMARIADIDDARVQVTLNYRGGRSLSQDILHNQFPVQELYSSAQIVRLSQFNWLQHFADRRVMVQIGWSSVGNDFARLSGFCKFQNLVICGHANPMTVNSGSLNGPISQWGARVKVWPTTHFYINVGAYRNNIDGGTDGGFDLSLDHHGSFYPLEIGWERREDAPPGSIAVGVYHNTGKVPDVYYDVNRDPAGLTGLPFLQRGGRHGGYVMGQQVVYQPETGNAARALSIMGIAGVGDSRTARYRRFAIVGALYAGAFARRPDDFVSIMVAWAPTNPRLSDFQRDRHHMRSDAASVQRWETEIEFDYGIQVTPRLLVQPNLQYIIQRGGNDERANALVLGLHFGVKL